MIKNNIIKIRVILNNFFRKIIIIIQFKKLNSHLSILIIKILIIIQHSAILLKNNIKFKKIKS
jgi:hypothetical protein